MACAVAESLDHLRPWMPWATNEAATVDAQRDRLIDAAAHWEDGTSHDYLMVTRPESRVVGACGLHHRVGEGGIELGYWVHVEHTGRGYARAAARALTEAASFLVGIERVEIHCDEANLASQAIPRGLGYRLDRTERHVIEAPGEIGQTMIWVLPVLRTRESEEP